MSLLSCKWHFHEGISKTKNTLNVTWMTFSDFIGLKNNIIIHLVLTAAVEVAESSLWCLLLNQTLTPLLLSSLSLENSSSTPCGVYLDSLYKAWRAILSESFVLPLELAPWAPFLFLIYKHIDQNLKRNIWEWNLLQLSYCLCHLNAQGVRDIENWNLRKFTCVTGGWIVLAKW